MIRLSSAKTRSCAPARPAGACSRGGGLRRCGRLEVELDGQAHEAHGAQRVVGAAPVGHQVQAAAADVLRAVVGSMSRPPAAARRSRSP
jgi:hypothetical protein